MQFFSVLALATAVSAAALNARSARLVARGGVAVCGGITQPVCCETDVDGVADLTCSAATKVPSSTDEFKSLCSAEGLTAECCTLVAGEDGLICSSA